MPYSRTTWQDSPSVVTPITAARLNNIEAGIVAAYVQGAGGLVNADIAVGAAIAYSKLNLALGIVNADISASAAIGISKLASYPSDATKFLRGDATWAVPFPTPATTLPGSPTNLQQAILVDNTATPTYAWLLQYSTTASAWIFIGGSDLLAEDTGASMGSLSSATYADTTRVVSLTVPRAGSYELFGSLGQSGSNVQADTLFSLKLGSAATTDNEMIGGAGSTGGGGWLAYNTATPFARTLAASDVVKVQYKTSGGAASVRWIKIGARPVKLT